MTKRIKRPPYFIQPARKKARGPFPPPFVLTGFALVEWNRILCCAPWLEESDATAIAERCVMAQRLRETDSDIAERGFILVTRNGKVKNPSVAMSVRYLSLLLRLDGELGLTPTSRQKISDAAADSFPASGSIDDPLERALCGDLPPLRKM